MQAGRLFRLCAIFAVAALVFGVAFAAGAGVDPASVVMTIPSGSSATILKTVHTPAIPPNPDIVFLADNTGSMGPTASNVAANATSIMNDVNSGVPAGSTAEFAAADYLDGDPAFCPTDPYAFKVDAPLTTATPVVQAAINTWPTTASLGFGCDVPESQINALYSIASGAIAFRPGSTRVVVWYGDSSGHDPSLGHTLTDAINALVAAHIIVIAVPVTSGSGDGLDSTGQASAVASATGGQVIPAASPSQVSAAILSGLHNLPVTVTPSATCDAGLTATYDAASKTVTSGTDATFTETLTVAANAPDGDVLNCTVDFLLNGTSTPGFQEAVAITVPLRSADLSIVKTASPPFVITGNTITYTLAVTNSSTDPDPGVVVTDALPSGVSFSGGDPACTAAASIVTCMFGTVGPGATVTKSFTAVVTATGPGVLTNTAVVTGTRPDPNPANNTSTATTQLAITCPASHNVNVRWHYSANGTSGSWSGTKSTSCANGSLTTDQQAMEGDLKLSPGTTLKTGYDFTLPGNKAPWTVVVENPTVTFTVRCVSGAAPSSSTLVVPMSTQTYSVSGDGWFPSGDQSSPLVYQGSAVVPDLCAGGQVRLDKGGTFSATFLLF